MHGTSDESVSPYDTINYYQRLSDHYGPSLMGFARFYLVPGYGHYSGVFNARWDPLEVLDAWADRKIAPETLVATDGNKGVDRSRPMCVYPNWPRYNGSGDVNIASSFSCSAK